MTSSLLSTVSEHTASTDYRFEDGIAIHLAKLTPDSESLATVHGPQEEVVNQESIRSRNHGAVSANAYFNISTTLLLHLRLFLKMVTKKMMIAELCW